jgi:hypothetical protein
MSEPQNKPQRRWRNTVILAVLVLVVYPLSIGPAALLTEKVGGRRNWVGRVGDVVYGPLGLVAKVTGTDGWVLRYVDWWLE